MTRIIALERVRSMAQAYDPRQGHMLAVFAVLLPALIGVLGLVIDGGVMRAKFRTTQNVADSAATAAAAALADGQPNSVVTSVAVDYVTNYNGLSSASVTVLVPPADGPYAGQAGYVEVQVSLPVSTLLMQAVGGTGSYHVNATAVAGNRPATAHAAVVVLDPNPPGFTVPAMAGLSLPATPSISLGGLEVLGLGQMRVNGAVHSNTAWGGVDQKGDPAGQLLGLRQSITCMPVVSLTSLAALDIRAVGGVDNPNNYVNYQAGQPSPLETNRKSVPDPLESLPLPTVYSDPVHVSATNMGGVSVPGLPTTGPVTTLQPGVYDYIQILSGTVVMQSGVYIIRGLNPLTNLSLEISGRQVTANGVMFYITTSTSYSASTGSPDSSTADTTPAPLSAMQAQPSVVINTGLLGTRLTPMSGTGSPYDGVLLFQNRTDRRIMIIGGDLLLTSGSFAGTVYSKWGHVIFAGSGTYDASFVAGSVRFVNVLDLALQPTRLFPPAYDVFLVQ